MKNLQGKGVLTVEISKDPKKVFNNSLWVGYRNGGMASWMSCLLPHLPHNEFCLFMDEDEYKKSEYMYSYYSEYFSKLFHREFVGMCVYPRKSIQSTMMKEFKTVTATSLREQMENQSASKHTVLLDLRGAEMAAKDSMQKVVEKFENSSYINLPLNDDDLSELIQEKIGHLPKNTQLVTLCAKGYRSAIGYSFLELVKKPSWDIVSCKTPLAEVKEELSKPREQKTEQVFSYAFWFIFFNFNIFHFFYWQSKGSLYLYFP